LIISKLRSISIWGKQTTSQGAYQEDSKAGEYRDGIEKRLAHEPATRWRRGRIGHDALAGTVVMVVIEKQTD